MSLEPVLLARFRIRTIELTSTHGTAVLKHHTLLRTKTGEHVLWTGGLGVDHLAIGAVNSYAAKEVIPVVSGPLDDERRGYAVSARSAEPLGDGHRHAAPDARLGNVFRF